MPNPDFLIVGASRSGTTSLNNYLRQHPQIFTPPEKEVHFFDFQYGKGMDWYQRKFKSEMVNGEASPYYLPCSYVPFRVAKHLPLVKIIVLCREPGARAHSHYWFNRVRKEEDKLFLGAVMAEEERLAGVDYGSPEWRRYSYLARGRYAEQLERWKHFRPMVIRSEDLFSNPEYIVGRICDWLGVQPHNFNGQRHRAQSYASMGKKARKWLDAYFEPHNAILQERWGISW